MSRCSLDASVFLTEAIKRPNVKQEQSRKITTGLLGVASLLHDSILTTY